VRAGDVPQTTLDFTGQKRDGTGLLHYHARQYDPKLGLFVSADTIVPGTASGGVSESSFLAGVNAERAGILARAAAIGGRHSSSPA
jgi:RHS repeat-associated protein